MKKQYPKIINGNLAGIWKTTKLNRIAEIIGGGTPDTKQSSYWNGGINWFSPTEVGKTVYLTKSEKTISQLGLQKSSAKLLPAFKTILFTSRAGIGDVGILTEESATNQGFQSLVVNEGTDVYFLYSYSDKIKNYALKHSAGSTFLEISGKELGKMDLSIPSLQEQSAIGSLFRTLDDLLVSYKDNLSNYQSLKATMLSKIFPKAGQTIPEIRLDGFEGEWGKYYLGDIFEQVSNYIEPSKENELWSLTVEKGLTPKTNRYKRDFLVKKNDKFKKVDVQEFVYNPMNLTLGALDLNDNEVTISVSGYYVVMKNRNMEKFDNDFLKILLKTTYAIYQYKQFATGTLIEKQRVQFPTFSEIPFYLPTIAEQRAIGAYFSILDNLIATHQEKISQLETLKKKLLQDMFI